MILSEKTKRSFNLEIMGLMKEVLPDVGKKCAIKYVPVRDATRPNFITGCYVVKVVIDRGSRDQVYSYLQEDRHGAFAAEKFSFKTENEVLEIFEVQRVLKIFKNKLQSPEKTFYPTHPQPCPEP
jgi:diphthamide synthase subunit DPH2